jgi:hypothetical protein
VIVTCKVIIAVTTSTNPANFACIFGDCEHACVKGLAVDCLFFVACDGVEVAEGHELLQGAMEKDKIAVLVLVRIQMLLLLKPCNCFNTLT